ARLTPSTWQYASPWEQEIWYDGWDPQAGWSPFHLRRGVLTQNIDSHESREIQAEKLVRLEDAGFNPVMHTHDEDVCEVLKNSRDLAEYLRLCRVLPEWARTPDGKPWPV